MLVRDKLTLLEIGQVNFEEKDSKFHFKSYSGLTVMRMPIPNLNKAVAVKVIDLMLLLNKRDGCIDVGKLSEISNNLDKLEEELNSFKVKEVVTVVKEVVTVVEEVKETVVEDETPEEVVEDATPEEEVEEVVEEETPEEEVETDTFSVENLPDGLRDIYEETLTPIDTFLDSLSVVETQSDAYKLYLDVKQSGITKEDVLLKLKHSTISSLDTLISVLEITLDNKFASRGAKAVAILERLESL